MDVDGLRVCSKLLLSNKSVDISLLLPHKNPIMMLETDKKV
jgi:hypothetical protein